MFFFDFQRSDFQRSDPFPLFKKDFFYCVVLGTIIEETAPALYKTRWRKGLCFVTKIP